MGRGDLSDKEWACLEPHLPTNRGRGGRWQSHRRVITGILFRQRTGLPWRDLPPCFGSWKTVHDRHRRWSADGTWERILRAVQADADAEGRIDWSIVSVDSTTCPRSSARGWCIHPMPPRSRVGAGARHVIVPMRPWDARGADSQARSTLPGRQVSPARLCHHARPVGGRTAHDSRPGRDPCAPTGWWTTAHSARPRRGDKAYSSRRNRRHLRRGQIKHHDPRAERPAGQPPVPRQPGPQASTRRSTAAATRSSRPSTGSSTSEPSPRTSTNGRTSSTGRSPWPRSAYGPVRSETPRYRHLGSGGAVR